MISVNKAMKTITDNEFDEMLKVANMFVGKEISPYIWTRPRFSEYDLRGKDFKNADLRICSIAHADLRGANFRGCDMREAYIVESDLRGADFTGADLRGACLNGCITDETTKGLPKLECPETGDFIAYKKVFEIGKDRALILKLRIPADALRSSATSNKCRADRAIPLEFFDVDGTPVKATKAHSWWRQEFIYELNKLVIADGSFNVDRWCECASGIHFFMTFEEAAEYTFS